LENGYKIKVLESDFQGVGVDTQADLDAVNKLGGIKIAPGGGWNMPQV
jgi:3-deoxy-manno-octulosonate cytidylyltransferase (CMP-KDO synthetase)